MNISISQYFWDTIFCQVTGTPPSSPSPFATASPKLVLSLEPNPLSFNRTFPEVAPEDVPKPYQAHQTSGGPDFPPPDLLEARFSLREVAEGFEMVSRNLEIASPKASKWYPEILKTHIPVIFIHRVDPTKSGPCHANQEYTFSWNPLKCRFQTSQGKFTMKRNTHKA